MAIMLTMSIKLKTRAGAVERFSLNPPSVKKGITFDTIYLLSIICSG